ncbi:MAG: hypothetical protein ABSE59_00110 [Opitutaceae bacterium]|jgi:hypothetical protein
MKSIIHAPEGPGRCASRATFRWIGGAGVVLALVFVCLGAWPVSPVEGDEMALLNGVHAWMHDTEHFVAVHYIYELQAGSYCMIRALTAATGAGLLPIFALTSALAAAGFVVATGLLGARILLVPFSACVIGLVLFCQEASAAASYANTSTYSGVAVFAGLALFASSRSTGRRLAAGIMIGLGGWMRLDALLAAPAALALRPTSPGGFRERVVETAQTASAALITVLSLDALSGFGPQDVWRVFSEKDVDIGYGPLIKWLPFLLTYTGLAGALAGLVCLVRDRAWRLLAICALGIIPSVIVHGRSITTTKYLYYAAPFMLLPLGYLLKKWFAGPGRAATRAKRAMAVLLIVAVSCEWLTAVRTTPADMQRFPARPTILKLASVSVHGHPWTWVLGASEAFIHDDGIRLRGGLFFAPWIWQELKRDALAALAVVRPRLRAGGHFQIIATSMFANHCVIGLLRAEGYRLITMDKIHPDAYGLVSQWRRGVDTCQLVVLLYDSHDREDFSHYAKELPGAECLLVNDRGPFGLPKLAGGELPWIHLSPSPLVLLEIFLRPAEPHTP